MAYLIVGVILACLVVCSNAFTAPGGHISVSKITATPRDLLTTVYFFGRKAKQVEPEPEEDEFKPYVPKKKKEYEQKKEALRQKSFDYRGVNELEEDESVIVPATAYFDAKGNDPFWTTVGGLAIGIPILTILYTQVLAPPDVEQAAKEFTYEQAASTSYASKRR
mmetsp:Transcript_21788/g.34267  ORF Transcript_21788/g.34267 Transcript_21788/m.34267 type:complete len:165 (+) Transcript_21788:41-535(+)